MDAVHSRFSLTPLQCFLIKARQRQVVKRVIKQKLIVLSLFDICIEKLYAVSAPITALSSTSISSLEQS